jgi:hypothetical protein
VASVNLLIVAYIVLAFREDTGKPRGPAPKVGIYAMAEKNRTD